MAQSLNKVKRRIATINSTRKITNAMKLVSNVKMRKYSKELNNQTLYIEGIKRVLSDVIFHNALNSDEKIDSPFIKKNLNATKTLYVIVTSNLGLCAGYNNEIFHHFSSLYKEGDELVLIGDKALINYSKSNVKYYVDFLKIAEGISMQSIRHLTDFLVKKYLSNEYKEVVIVYHEYVNTLISLPKSAVLLPIPVLENEEYNYDPLYVPGKKAVIDYIVPQYLNTFIYQKLYSSLISENSARRNAMDNADQNAKDIVEKLNLEYNKERQQAITQEISEVVAGSKNK